MPILELIRILKQWKIEYEENVELAPYTSFRIGGPCWILARPKCAEEFQASVKAAQSVEINYCILGNGSNVLVSDEGFPGMIILTTALTGLSLEPLEEGVMLLGCGAGVSLSKLCSVALENSLEGLEFAWGIPGSVGGAVYMNAGAYGGEIKDVLYDCAFLNETGETYSFLNGKLDFSYRHSIFSDSQYAILKARFALRSGCAGEIKARMDDYINRRREKQPLDYPSAGSVFKRPAGNYASALIEQCGLKGFAIGGAQISEKHSGFIINKGGATCRDVLGLIEQVRRKVLEQTGYTLECEIKRIG